MDLFKKKNMNLADDLDWNCKEIVKRQKGVSVHKLSRHKIKEDTINNKEYYDNSFENENNHIPYID
jgi:hypothetical protein